MLKLYGAGVRGVKLFGVEVREVKLSGAGEQEVKHDVRFPVQVPKHLPARAGSVHLGSGIPPQHPYPV